MKGSGDDNNHRLGEMLLFLVLLSLVLFCCLARPTVETKQYIEMLCIECETKKTQDEIATLFQYIESTNAIKAYIYMMIRSNIKRNYKQMCSRNYLN